MSDVLVCMYLDVCIHVSSRVNNEGSSFVGDYVRGLGHALQVVYPHLQPVFRENGLQTALKEGRHGEGEGARDRQSRDRLLKCVYTSTSRQ